MISIKLLSIDTSILGSVAKSYFSGETPLYETASKFMCTIDDNGLIPFFSHHHIQELLQHDDDRIVRDRWSMIKKFPIVAWLRDEMDKNLLGSMIDVHAAELRYLLKDRSLNMIEIIKKAKADVVTYASGEEFVKCFESTYSEMRRIGAFNVQKARSIESLSHVRDPETDNIKLSELNNSRLKSPNEVLKWSKGYMTTVEKSLVDKGDPKLINHSKISHDFVLQVVDDGKALYKNNGLSLLEIFVVSSGVDLSQINSDSTHGDLGYLAIFNKKMEIVANRCSYDLNKIKMIPEEIPSWVIWREFDKIIRKENRAHGSNMLDKYMAVLALYVDFSIVDKRIYECFKQLQNKLPYLSERPNSVFKLSSFSDLEQIVFTY